MKLQNMNEVNRFKEAVDSCEGSVWMTNADGETFDMKNDISQFKGIAAMLEDDNEELELFARSTHDENILMGFIVDLERERVAA